MARFIIHYCIASIFVVTCCDAQVNLSIHIKQPTPSELSVWERDPTIVQIHITNASSTLYQNVRISFTVMDVNSGRIVARTIDDSPSALRFNLLPHSSLTRNGPEVVNSQSVRIDESIKTIAVTTNSLPEGDFEYCVRLLAEDGAEIGLVGNRCRFFRIVIPDPPTLISPRDRDTLRTSVLPLFSWSRVFIAPGREAFYNLKIVPLYGDQRTNVQDALDHNPPIFEARQLRVPFYQYAISDRQFATDLRAEGFAWQVQAVDERGQPATRNEGKSLLHMLVSPEARLTIDRGQYGLTIPKRGITRIDLFSPNDRSIVTNHAFNHFGFGCLKWNLVDEGGEIQGMTNTGFTPGGEPITKQIISNFPKGTKMLWRLRVVRVYSGQTSIEAIAKNVPWKEFIDTFPRHDDAEMYQLVRDASPSPFAGTYSVIRSKARADVEFGVDYAWQVSAKPTSWPETDSMISEVWTFRIQPPTFQAQNLLSMEYSYGFGDAGDYASRKSRLLFREWPLGDDSVGYPRLLNYLSGIDIKNHAEDLANGFWEILIPGYGLYTTHKRAIEKISEGAEVFRNITKLWQEIQRNVPIYEWGPVVNPDDERDQINNIVVNGWALNTMVSDRDVHMAHPFGFDYEIFVSPDTNSTFFLAPSNTPDDSTTKDAFRHAISEIRSYGLPSKGIINVETDSGFVPRWYRPKFGDRVAILGRWIQDYGHNDFHTEIHPPLILASARAYYKDQELGQNDEELIPLRYQKNHSDDPQTVVKVITAPFLVSQHLKHDPKESADDGVPMLEHFKNELIGVLAGLNDLIRAHSILYPPYKERFSVDLVVCPPTKRVSKNDKLWVAYHFVCRTGVQVRVENLNDDSVKIHIEFSPYTPPRLQPIPTKLSINELGTLDERVGTIWTALKKNTDVFWDPPFSTRSYEALEKGYMLIDSYAPISAKSAHVNQVVWRYAPDLKSQAQHQVIDDSQLFPVFGWMIIRWDRDLRPGTQYQAPQGVPQSNPTPTLIKKP